MLALGRFPNWLLVGMAVAAFYLVPTNAYAIQVDHAAETAQAAEREGPDARGVFVTAEGADTTRFVPWSESVVQAELTALAAKGGELRFAPGTYELEVGFELNAAKNVRIVGASGTTLRFAEAPEASFALTKAASVGDTYLHIRGAEHLVAGRRYQVYPASREGDRLLEFTVAMIDGGIVTLARPVHFMGHVKAIPEGAAVLQELNAFRIMRSSDIAIEGLTIDGIGRGDVRGHTTFCGIYVVGNPPGKSIPKLGGLTVRGCTLERLTGRALCVYRMERVLVEGCTVRDIKVEGIELDHFTSGRVVGCDVSRCGVGIVLNDAFDSVVERNTVAGCVIGIAMIKHFTHPAVNCGLTVQDNQLRSNRSFGISVRPGITGNVVRRNQFVDHREDRRIKGGEGNELLDNVAR